MITEIVYVSDDDIVCPAILASKEIDLGTLVPRELLSHDSGDVSTRPILEGQVKEYTLTET